MSDYVSSIIRTSAALLAGWLISLPIIASVPLPEGTARSYVEATIVSLVTAAYYRAARWLESLYGSRFGWLLLRPGAPINPAAAGVIRTVSPGVVAELVLIAHPLGIPDAQFNTLFGALVPFLLASVYYAVSRALERWAPGFGVLLGWIGSPNYTELQS